MSPEEMFAALAAPFPPSAVSWRIGSTNREKTKAMALAFIDARDVMERLDAVCTPAGWERRHPHVEKTTTCEIALWVEGRGWVVKSDGAGDTQVEAEKGSLSDSFKRAAVNWGVGRYLYDLASPWVELEEGGKRIKQSEMGKLEAVLKRSGPRSEPQRQAPPAPMAAAPPTSGANAPAAAKPSLAERSRALEATMRKVKTPADLRKAWDLASGLCAALDTADPDRLAELEALYASLFETLTDAAPPKRDDFGLSGDDVPAFN